MPEKFEGGVSPESKEMMTFGSLTEALVWLKKQKVPTEVLVNASDKFTNMIVGIKDAGNGELRPYYRHRDAEVGDFTWIG